LFSSFDDVFPSEVPIQTALDNKVIKDLAEISGLNIDTIKKGIPANKMRHKDQLNIALKKEYQKYWTQDLANLHIDWDSTNIQFYIKEDDHFFQPSIRSKGKQWHLAFYVRITARAKEDSWNIILIDEPGLFLHAKAQKDILLKLEDSAKDAQIVFSTHSPYLIDTNHLDRIRLITKDNSNGTTISNKIHKGADLESLTPIITAIGLDLSAGVNFAKDNNVLLEGISDYYYIAAVNHITKYKYKHDTHIIPGACADKFHFMVPLLLGWGLKFCLVLDNDKKGRAVAKNISEEYGSNGWVVYVSDQTDGEIEDLFTREDFIKYVLGKNPEDFPVDISNSRVLKQRDYGYDKVLLAKIFYEKAKNDTIKTKLSKTTIDRFLAVFKNIDTALDA
jgi:predicted ATP-dependent endonuclease of OLD family